MSTCSCSPRVGQKLQNQLRIIKSLIYVCAVRKAGQGLLQQPQWVEIICLIALLCTLEGTGFVVNHMIQATCVAAHQLPSQTQSLVIPAEHAKTCY
eukprot:scaffold143807_cov36-Prasinocladus_malaysianus.AAC.3